MDNLALEIQDLQNIEMKDTSKEGVEFPVVIEVTAKTLMMMLSTVN